MKSLNPSRLIAFLPILLLFVAPNAGLAEGQERQALCHYTKSVKNPYVVITVADPAWEEHAEHDDIPFGDCCLDSDCADNQRCGDEGMCVGLCDGLPSFSCGENIDDFSCGSQDGWCGATAEGIPQCVSLISPATCRNFRRHRCQTSDDCTAGDVCVTDTCVKNACGFNNICLPITE